MLTLGLVGKGISHSLSQEIYEKILNEPIDYIKYDCSSENNIPTLNAIFRDVSGLSITSPYKRYYLRHSKLSPEAMAVGAINCIRKKDGIFEATNTDLLAVEQILRSRFKMAKDMTIILLGDGTMAKVTIFALEKLKLDFTQLARSKGDDLNDLSRVPDNKDRLIINTCSRDFEFDGKLFLGDIFWDHNYSMKNHEHNLSQRCNYIDGVELLELQARYALDFWNLKAIEKPSSK